MAELRAIRMVLVFRILVQRILIRRILILFIISPAELHPQSQGGTLPGKAALSVGPVEYAVSYQEGRRDWAEYIRAVTGRFLEASEKYLARRFSRSESFSVNGREEVTHRGFRVGGMNLGDSVELEYGIRRTGEPALLFHELGHFWYAYSSGGDGSNEELSWLIEGIVSFLPVAMREAGFFEFSDSEYRAIQLHWAFEDHKREKDLPVAHDFRFETGGDFSGFFYIKTFKIQYLLFKELGPEGYRRSLREIPTVSATGTNRQILAVLNRLKPADWHSLLSGWVFPGDYRVVSYSDFRDVDCDGLLSVDEHFLGTDPRNGDTDGDALPDGTEREFGLDPVSADPDEKVAELTFRFGPFIDGTAVDWGYLPCVVLEAATGGAEEPAFDFSRLFFNLRDGHLNVAVGTRASPVPRPGMIFDLLVDLDFDRQPELEFAFSLDNPSHSWIYRHATKKAETLPALKGAMNSIFEMAVPLSSIGKSRFQIIPVIHDLEKGKNYAEWKSWIEIDLDVLGGVERYNLRTDLLAADTDRDGIPDKCELLNKLDPNQPDPPETLVKFAPFLDGVDTEWKRLGSSSSADRAEDVQEEGGLASLDFLRLSYLARESSLWVMVETRGRPSNGPRIIFDVLLDLDNDKSHDMEFAFFMDTPGAPWVYRRKTQKAENPRGLASARESVIEMVIPIDEIGVQEFRILPIFFNPDRGMNHDEWDDWIEIDCGRGDPSRR